MSDRRSGEGCFTVMAVALLLMFLAVPVSFIDMSCESRAGKTQGQLPHQAKLYLYSDHDEDEKTWTELEHRDAWGRRIQGRYEVSKYAVEADVRSAGEDGEFGTADDLTAEASDINKSRIVGEWAARKVKEAAKGFADGLKQKTPFKDREAE